MTWITKFLIYWRLCWELRLLGAHLEEVQHLSKVKSWVFEQQRLFIKLSKVFKKVTSPRSFFTDSIIMWQVAPNAESEWNQRWASLSFYWCKFRLIEAQRYIFHATSIVMHSVKERLGIFFHFRQPILLLAQRLIIFVILDLKSLSVCLNPFIKCAQLPLAL